MRNNRNNKQTIIICRMTKDTHTYIQHNDNSNSNTNHNYNSIYSINVKFAVNQCVKVVKHTSNDSCGIQRF